MPDNRDSNDIDSGELLIRILKRTMEDLVEAYFRTPYYVSSKKYVERALRRIQHAYSYMISMKHNKNLREPK